MSQYTYLDYAAATPLDPRVLEAMQPYLSEHYANPSSLHRLGREQRLVFEDVRGRIAKILGAKSAEIVFTSGSTEAAKIAIEGVMRQFPDGRVVVSAIEHESILAECNQFEGRIDLLSVTSEGLVKLDQLRSLINDETVLVVIQYANNEIGTVQPIAKIAQLIAEIRLDRKQRGVEGPIYLYTDAAQAGLLSLAVARLGVDLMSLGSNKLHGPVGIGALYIRTGIQLKSTLPGGGQESGLRGGTENVAGAVGMATALELIQEDRNEESRRQTQLRDWLWAEVSSRIDGVELNGGIKNRLPGNLNILVESADGETMVAYLDREGFAVATGSACTAANQDPSHVLLAIGRSKIEAESSLRITIGRQTTKQDLERLVEALEKVIPRVRELTAGM